MKKTTFILSLSFFLFTISAQVVDTTHQSKLKSYLFKIQKFTNDFPQEKVYLHLDNSSYYLGENIWFKAYIVKADKNTLSQVSKILYVELLNSEGYVVDKKKLKIDNGQCYGNFILPTNIYGGFYEIRAYTRFMQNFGTQNYFSRVLPIFDKPIEDGYYLPNITERANTQKIPNKRPPAEDKIVMSFYPEGGSLVNGINSRVAFKTIGKGGNNLIVTGGLYNDKNEKITDIETSYQGMGVFSFTPDKGKYVAKIQIDKKEYEFKLPDALPFGYVMTVDNLSDSTDLVLQVEKNPLQPQKPLAISITCRGLVYGFQQVTFSDDTVFTTSIPRKALPSGVSQITLYSDNGKIESERLVFVNNHSNLNIQYASDKSTYSPYEKVSMNFDLSDNKNKPVETSFSVAVKDAGNSPELVKGDNILTNLLLSSELKGYIENPGYYFESNSPLRNKLLDLLLMTQGWRRYDWKQMAGIEKFNLKQYVDKQLTIDGSVSSVLLKKKIANAKINLTLMSDSTSQRGECITDSLGTFNFAIKDFVGSGDLILQSFVNDKKKEMYILLNRQFSPDLKSYSASEVGSLLEFKSNDKTAINIQKEDSVNLDSKSSKLSKDQTLKEVTVVGKRNKIPQPAKVSISYNIASEIDKIADEGKSQSNNVGMLMEKLNKYVSFEPCSDGTSFKCRYKGKPLIFVRDNSIFVSNSFSENSLVNPVTRPTTENTQTSQSASKGIDPEQKKKDDLSDLEGCVTDFQGIDEIESLKIVENYGSILQFFPDVVRLKKTDVVLAIVHLKIPYVKEEYGIRNTKFDGYSYVSQYYSPNYSYSKPSPTEKDYRRTLYWNPDVKTDKNGKATIHFYNNGSCKSMNISAETVTANGQMGGTW